MILVKTGEAMPDTLVDGLKKLKEVKSVTPVLF
jgi:hypothetical protein